MFNLHNVRFWQSIVSYCTMRSLYAVVLLIGDIFLLGALWSFDKHDPSILYISSYKLYCSNWCGTWGAQVAALLFFLGGSAAFVLPIFFAFLALRIFYAPKTRDYDMVIAYFVLLMSVAGFCNYYHIDPMNCYVPGGVVGYICYQSLSVIFDQVMVLLFLSMLCLISLILITRFSCIAMGRYGAVGLSYVFIGMRFICSFIYKASLLCMQVSQKLWNMLQGAEVHTEDCSIVDFESMQDDNVHPIDDDAFWDTFFGIEPIKKSIAEEVKEEIINKCSVVQQPKELYKKYEIPDVSLFTYPIAQSATAEQNQNNQQLAHVLEEKLERFGIQGSVISIKIGPVITLFEYQPHIDTKISKIIALEDDLALALQAVSIRIIAPIPGKSVVGFEVANKHRSNVFLARALQSKEFQNSSLHLPLVLGEDSIGATVIVDLAAMPHLLVAGSTGSGKSVALNAMLVSLLCRHTPQELKLILIDPKRLEFAAYADIPHLLVPIVTDPRKVAPVLRWVVGTMEERYAHMESLNVRNIFDYHQLCEQQPELTPMPFMVIIIDELADLMMTAGREIEDLIARITQMARAAGIHCIVATQRPSVDVITGLIKVNFPCRISFRVTSKVDSRTILDCIGADKLLGKGDMLYLDSTSRLQRVHGSFISDVERGKLIQHLRSQQPAEYIDMTQDSIITSGDFFEEDETLYQDVITFIATIDEVSISLLQRKFRIGYNRSARIIDRLQAEGIILQEPGGKTRKVIK